MLCSRNPLAGVGTGVALSRKWVLTFSLMLAGCTAAKTMTDGGVTERQNVLNEARIHVLGLYGNDGYRDLWSDPKRVSTTYYEVELDRLDERALLARENPVRVDSIRILVSIQGRGTQTIRAKTVDWYPSKAWVTYISDLLTQGVATRGDVEAVEAPPAQGAVTTQNDSAAGAEERGHQE
jgi:hypothetical protein